ncbi:MAG: nicotinate-nucleotide adenylyltransferase [Oribacterium sp.]
MRGRKIGLLGGTFDPIHRAHLALADCAFRTLSLDELWLLPAGMPYMDKHSGITNAETRAEMAELAIRGRRGYRVERIELERQGKSYTADTLRLLRERVPEADFYFLIGSDQLYAFPRWHDPEALSALCRFAVAARELPGQRRNLGEQAAYLFRKYRMEITLLPFSEQEISSTEIRRMIREGRDVSKWLPPEVYAYILSHRLYQ